MTIDYPQLAAVATRLIAANGREVTFVQLDDNLSSDLTKPWRGQDNPRSHANTVTGVPCAFVPFSVSGAVDLGFLETLDDRAQQVAMVSATGLGEFEIEEADEIIDGDVVWRVLYVHKLKPADTTVMYAIGVQR